MGEELKVKLTCEEGNVLLQLAAAFGLPEKLADQSFSVPDRAIAADEVSVLYKTLKSYSPASQGRRGLYVFGPLSNLEEEKVNKDGDRYREHVDPYLEIEVRLRSDALSGAMWCLLGAVCPATGERGSLAVRTQSDLLWPIAAKLDRTKAIREIIGYSKGTPRRWKTDEDYAKDEKKPEEKK